ncbi:non-hydrolyzing UDP-N-acetylglucosamine 2-epimerase [Algoriphagus sp. AK58]|uniref:non-hydrolyzing UDP-N-acetylglucosamine 2-epimerase n=1 Tax=Algoriphagus sp. AK58 TaxID=1406877 RepID=UPI00164FE82D|nr:UDP-N-acetylglucosamine 2-epimerase (non-hydrolyzing) [Algoriphagus sp. AK58]MBC6367461.1 UDP-N-acetylglucosamine 2-epimerase (non-hydrolyzing) [Algoriphagus sp. AK58]
MVKIPSIVSVVGARPQFIKHAPIQIELAKFFRAFTIHTGQHYDDNMSKFFFNELGIPNPDYLFDQKDIVRQGAQTGKMLTEIEDVFIEVSPDLVLVYGDTNSTIAGALAASKLMIPVIHIEAGLRSFNREMPEEINRLVTDQLSELLFCPSDQAVRNLNEEGINSSKIFRSGDVMCDMVRILESKLTPKISGDYYFATIHRPYNTDDPDRLKEIFENLSLLKHKVYFAIHPRTKSKLKSFNIDIEHYPNIQLLDPQGYIDSLSLQKFARGIITDSGGIQKEAYLLKVKCVTLRKETEWIETLSEGWNTLIFDNLEEIQSCLDQIPGLHNSELYGDGNSAKYIVETIRNYFFKK